MNEELQNTLASVLEKSMEVAEKTGQWALDIAPELIEQYLMWEFYSALFLAVVCLVVLGVSIPLVIKAYKDTQKPYLEQSEGFQIFGVSVGITGLIISLPFLFIHIYTMIFIKVAPEIYLIKNLL